MEMMLDKPQIRAIFLFEFKMGLKAVENTRNKTTHLAQKLHWWFTALKIRTVMARHGKLTVTKGEDNRSWSPYNHTRSCRRTQRWPFYSCSAFEANQKGEKAG